MTRQTKRAERIQHYEPIQVSGSGGRLQAVTRDLSRTGFMMRVSKEALGCPSDLRFGVVAVRIQRLLGARFVIAFEQEGSAEPLSKAVTLVRLTEESGNPGIVEVGCRFDESLSDLEIRAVGADCLLEAAAVQPAQAAPRETDPQSRCGEAEPPTEHWPPLRGALAGSRAFITGSSSNAPPPIHGILRGINPHGARIRIPTRAIQTKGGAPDIVASAHELIASYGSEVTLKYMAGSRHLWTGRASLNGIGVCGDVQDSLYLTFALARRMRSHELVRLGLA